MMTRVALFYLFLIAAAASVVWAQNAPSQAETTKSSFTADYPSDRPGVFIESSAWQSLSNEMPAKTKAARGIAASLSYGMVPAKIIAEYPGEHAATRIDAGQITICVCHILSLPGEPVLVRLHPKRGARELDGGKLIVYPVVGGSKMADADKTDLISVQQSQPEAQVWLVRSPSPLPPGEYALMLGTQNMSIYTFTVSAPPNTSTAK